LTKQFHEDEEVEVFSNSGDGKFVPVWHWRKAKITGAQWPAVGYEVQFPDGTCDVFDADHIREIDCEGPPRRPSGANADEWHLFLCAHLESRAAYPRGLNHVAIQIAEAIEAAEKRGWRRSS
jgi:hypothetical protein